MNASTFPTGWAVIRRFAIPVGGEHAAAVVTLRVPAVQPGGAVVADLSWQGQQPAPDDVGARQVLARHVNQIARSLGARITLAKVEA